MEKNVNNNISSKFDWDIIGTIFIAVATFFTLIFYIVEMKVDIAKLQVKVEKLEENK